MKHDELDNVLADLRVYLEQNDLSKAIAIIEALHPPDQADLVAELEAPDQVTLLTQLAPSESADVLEEMDDEEAASLADMLPTEQLADILDEMEDDEAADILGDLPPEEGCRNPAGNGRTDRCYRADAIS